METTTRLFARYAAKYWQSLPADKKRLADSTQAGWSHLAIGMLCVLGDIRLSRASFLQGTWVGKVRQILLLGAIHRAVFFTSWANHSLVKRVDRERLMECNRLASALSFLGVAFCCFKGPVTFNDLKRMYAAPLLYKKELAIWGSLLGAILSYGGVRIFSPTLQERRQAALEEKNKAKEALQKAHKSDQAAQRKEQKILDKLTKIDQQLKLISEKRRFLGDLLRNDESVNFMEVWKKGWKESVEKVEKKLGQSTKKPGAGFKTYQELSEKQAVLNQALSFLEKVEAEQWNEQKISQELASLNVEEQKCNELKKQPQEELLAVQKENKKIKRACKETHAAFELTQKASNRANRLYLRNIGASTDDSDDKLDLNGIEKEGSDSDAEGVQGEEDSDGESVLKFGGRGEGLDTEEGEEGSDDDIGEVEEGGAWQNIGYNSDEADFDINDPASW